LERAKAVSSISNFVVTGPGIRDIIIPFFDTYPLLTAKSLDYEDWKLLISMHRAGEFKTDLGRKTMLSIRSGMNRGRT